MSAWPGGLSGRREAISVSLAAAEVSWMAPIVVTLNPGVTHPPLLLWLGLLVLMLTFSYFYRALAAANLPLRTQQAVLSVGLLFAIGLFIRYHIYAGLKLQGQEWLPFLLHRLSDTPLFIAGELLAAVLVIYFWGRAIHLARRSLSTAAVGFTFRAGVVILTWFGLGAGLMAGADVTLFVVPFFFFALLAVSLARIEEVSQMPGGSQVQFSSYWVGSSMAAVGVLVLVATVVAAFFYSGGLQPILRLLTPLLVVLVAVLVGIGLLVFAGFSLIFSRLSLDFGGLDDLLQRMMAGLDSLARDLAAADANNPSGLAVTRAVNLGGSLLLVAGLIALVLVVTWYRLRRDAGAQANESRESLFSAGAVGQGLLDLLRAGRRRLAEGLAAMGRLGAGQWLAALSIRRIYAQLAHLAAERGYPRPTATTPYEYLDVLQRAFADSQGEVALITEAYVNAHYGQLPDTPEDLQLIRDAWERLRQRQTARQK